MTVGLGYTIAGLCLMIAALLPRLTDGRAFSPALAFTAVGVALGLSPLDLPSTIPPDESWLDAVEQITCVVVIVAVFGVGLAIDRPIGWRSWQPTWRLLLLAMPLAIGASALVGWWLLALSLPAALLVAACLAPTDPVLAGDVQVGEPSDEPHAEDEVRLTLTAEAGLNDALAFPFVMAAMFAAGIAVSSSWWEWFAWQLIGRCLVAVIVGWALGWLLARLAFRVEQPELQLARHSEVYLALTAIALSYGLTELVHGYGFLAVFVTAVVFRAHEPASEYQRVLHTFVSQLERLLTLVLLVALGYGCARGLLKAISPSVIVFALVMVLVLRPVVAWLVLPRTVLSAKERLVVAFFGVRGIGSFYYLAYALGESTWVQRDLLWAAVSTTVLVSLVVHGTLAGPILTRMDATRARHAAEARRRRHRALAHPPD